MIKIVACGKIKEKWLQEGIQEYIKRITSYDRIELVEVEDEKTNQNASDAQNRQTIEKEGLRLLGKIKEDEYVILLDLHGQNISTMQFKEKIEQCYVYGQSKITFVIGGSLGVSQALRQRAQFCWQLSKCTFTHQMCRLLLVEQIYRIYKIMQHEPYHK